MAARWWNPTIESSRHLRLVPDERLLRADHIPAERTLHLVDLENLMGGPFQSVEAMHYASDWYRHTAPVRPADHVIVAVNPKLAVVARSEWPRILMRVAKGPDGADLALIKELQDPSWVASHYGRVMVGSGDGIFAPAIEAMRAHGITVGVLARERQVSRALRRSANFVTLFSRADAVKSVA